jgi:glutamyl-tRNA synthetase
MGIKATADSRLVRVVVNLRERARTLREMAQMAEYFFRDDFAFDEAARAKFLTPATKPILVDFAEGLKNIASMDEEEGLKVLIEGLTKKYNAKPVGIIQPVRVALCGRTVSPGIFEVIAILGKEAVEKRVARAVESIQ